jgi:uncharacterized membrane protein YkvA (DUF1232 family)
MSHITSFVPHWKNLYGFIKDPSADWKPKVAIILAVGYLIWPIDLVPDLVPIIGWLDDIGVTTLATAYLLYAANEYAQSKSTPDVRPPKRLDGPTV